MLFMNYLRNAGVWVPSLVWARAAQCCLYPVSPVQCAGHRQSDGDQGRHNTLCTVTTLTMGDIRGPQWASSQGHFQNPKSVKPRDGLRIQLQRTLSLSSNLLFCWRKRIRNRASHWQFGGVVREKRDSYHREPILTLISHSPWTLYLPAILGQHLPTFREQIRFQR